MARKLWMAAGAAALLAVAGCQKKTAEKATGTQAQAGADSRASAAPTQPRRKAGLWEQKVSFGKVDQVSSICLDEAADEKMGWSGQPADKPCSQNTVTPHAGGGWEFSTVCDMGENGKVASHGVATGDFSSHYRMDMESTTTGASAPQMNGSRKFTLEADWKGPCPADMKPGDISLPGGMRITPSQIKAK